MNHKKDYTSYSFLLTVAVIAILLLAGLLPSFHIAGVKIKRVNILSDVYSPEETLDTLREYSDTAFAAEAAKHTTPPDVADGVVTGSSQSWDISGSNIVSVSGPAASVPGLTQGARSVVAASATPAGASVNVGGTPPQDAGKVDPASYDMPSALVDDFAPGNMTRFYSALLKGNPQRPVRVAVLGDSFIEADILTADLREQLQAVFGGSGVGFVPFASPLAKYRGTVKHNIDGWESYTVTRKNSTPAAFKDKYFVSGLVCVPSEGGSVRIAGTNFRRNISNCSVARLLFVNSGNSTIEVTVNDTIKSSFKPESSPLVQQISLNGNIASIKARITNAAGFTGYGVVLESKGGVSVDNFSIRGNSGMALFGTNSSINAQIGKLLGYDLIILQYGLNAMSPDVLNYNAYAAQLVKIINYVHECFPGAALMMMSVGDRSTQRAGEYVTMPAVRAMIAAQQKAATECGIAFWNTFQAMGGEKSMVKFVQNKWAAKDYTHIGYPGGKFIATQMVSSLLYGYRAYKGEGVPSFAVAGGSTAAPAQGDSSVHPAVPHLPALDPDSTSRR